LFTSFTPLRQTARSQLTKRADARGPKALRSSTPPTGPKSNAVVASQHPIDASLRLGASEATRHRAMRSEPNLVFVSPFGRAEQHRALQLRAQHASSSDFATFV
jgi:hypothetical protein